MKEVVRRACANALFEAGFPLEESGSGFGSPDPGTYCPLYIDCILVFELYISVY